MSSENQQQVQMMQNPEELQQHKLQQQISMQQQQQQPLGGMPIMDPSQFRVGDIQQQNQQLQGNPQFLQGLSTSSSPTFPVSCEGGNQHKNGQVQLQEKMLSNHSQMNGDITSISQGAGAQVQSKVESNSQVIQQQQQLQQQQSQLQSESQDISDENDQGGQEEDDENDQDEDGEGDDETGKGSGANNKKKYQVISQDIREKFIQKVISKQVTIKEAAKEFGLKFSTSKAILQTFKKEGRIGKKKTRQRKPRLVKKMIMNPDPLNPSQVIQQVFYTTESSMMAAKNQQAAAANMMNTNQVVNAALLNQPHLTQYIIKNNAITNLPVQNYAAQNLNGQNNPQSLMEAQYFQQKMFNNQMYPGQQVSQQQVQQQQQFNLQQHNTLLNPQNQQNPQQLQSQQNAAVAAAVAQLGNQQNAFQSSLTPQLQPLLGNNDLINNYMMNGGPFSLTGNNNQQTQSQQNQQAQIQQSQQTQSPTQLNPNQLHHALLGVANGNNATNQIAQSLNYHQNQQQQQQAFPLLQQQQSINSLFAPNSPFLSAQPAPSATQQQSLNQLIGQQTTYGFPMNKGSADFFLNFNQFSQPQQTTTQTQNTQQQLNQFLNPQGAQNYDMQLNPAKIDNGANSQPNRTSSNGVATTTDNSTKEKGSGDDINVSGSQTNGHQGQKHQALLSELAEMSQQFKKQNFTHLFPTTESSQSYQMNIPSTTSTANTTNNSTNSSANRASHLQSIQFFGTLGGRHDSGSFDSINGNALNLQLFAGQQSLENNPLYQNKLSTDSINFNIFGNSATAGNVPLGFPSIDMASQIPYLFNNNNAAQNTTGQMFSTQIHKNSIF